MFFRTTFVDAIILLTVLYMVRADIKDFYLQFEKMEVGYQDPKVLQENVTCRKFNRTTVTTSIYENLYAPLLDGEISVKVRGYQFLSNTYRLTSIQFDYDYCAMLYLGAFGDKNFKKNTNYPSLCPIPVGKYYIKDGTISTDITTYFGSATDVPPNFIGKWKLSMTYLRRKKPYLTYNWYAEVKKRVKW